jgi:hypothetical protein
MYMYTSREHNSEQDHPVNAGNQFFKNMAPSRIWKPYLQMKIYFVNKRRADYVRGMLLRFSPEYFIFPSAV